MLKNILLHIKKWVTDKIFDFIDTSIQACYLSNETTITENIINVVIEQIYGCKISKVSSPSKIEFDYTETIHNVLSEREEYKPYKLSPDATKLLSHHVENLGRFLTAPLSIISNKVTPTYKMLKERIHSLG